METLAVGCGAGFSGDRVDAAAPVVRTLIAARRAGGADVRDAGRAHARAPASSRARPTRKLGYEPLLDLELRAGAWPTACSTASPSSAISARPIPRGAARRIPSLARELRPARSRASRWSPATTSRIATRRPILRECLGGELDESRFVCANAYQGAIEIADAIRAGAQVVVTGRVADPSLALGPAIAHYGWGRTTGTSSPAPRWRAICSNAGRRSRAATSPIPAARTWPTSRTSAFRSRRSRRTAAASSRRPRTPAASSTRRTVKEQLLYEIHDPAAYITPDVVADITQATVAQVGPDRVRLSGVRGHPRTATLKATVFFDGGWLGEARDLVCRARTPRHVRASARTSCASAWARWLDLRFDLIGVTSILGDDAGDACSAQAPVGDARDVRLRVAAQARGRGRHRSPAARAHRAVDRRPGRRRRRARRASASACRARAASCRASCARELLDARPEEPP